MRTNITDLPTARAIYNPTEETTFSEITPGNTAVYTIFPLPRQFRPGVNTGILFPEGMYTGILVSQVSVTGSALGGWTATYSLTNQSSNNITPISQMVVLYQVA